MALGPSKNYPRERFWKNMQKQWNIYRKIDGFWWSQTFEKYWKTYFYWFSVIHKNNLKTMPKGTSQVVFLDPKWRHGRPRFDLSSDFLCFEPMPQKHDFSTPPRCTNKSNKSSRGAPKGRKRCHRLFANAKSRRQGSPGSIESRTLWPLDHPERIPTHRWAEGLAIFICIFESFFNPKW